MSRNGKLRKHYDRLDPLERLSLALMASARDDGDEVDALFNSCPDIQEFINIMTALGSMATTLGLRLLTADIMLLALDGDEHYGGTEELLKVMNMARYMWAGYAAWCEEAGLPPRLTLELIPMGPPAEDPLAWYLGAILDVIDDLSLSLSVPPDETKEWRDFYARTWAISMGVEHETERQIPQAL